jgi:hypothetical protein
MISDATSRNAVKIVDKMSHIENRPVGQEVLTPLRRRKCMSLGKRGTVAVMVALCAPLLFMTVGLGIEASGWVIRERGTLQRTADMARRHETPGIDG